MPGFGEVCGPNGYLAAPAEYMLPINRYLLVGG